MTKIISDLSQRHASGIAGYGYLIIIISGIFAEFFMRSPLIVHGNAAAISANIMVSEGMFRIGIAADMVMLISDVVVALALYVLLRPVNRGLALMAAFFRLVHAAVYGTNLLNLFFVLQLAGGSAYLSAFSTDQINALVMVFLNGHSTGYLIGLVFFGIHCFILGYLVIRSGFIPAVLGVFLIIAGAGYLIDSYANFLFPGYENYKTVFQLVVFIPAFIGELSFCIWLIIKGTRMDYALSSI